jgi:hypothetical protein
MREGNFMMLSKSSQRAKGFSCETKMATVTKFAEPGAKVTFLSFPATQSGTFESHIRA